MSNRTGFLYDDKYQEHLTGNYHPEMPDRLPAVYKGIQEAGLLEQLTLIKAVPADLKWVETVHDPQYIKRLQEACNSGSNIFDSPDNQMCAATYEVSLLAVGGVLEAARLVMEDELDNAFCAVRPPGHHAEVSQAMGFCYFNNVAIAARYLQSKWQIKKVGIIDFDVHHGNGTQHIFENDPTVFYYSIHQHPSFAYPGTGREFEFGSGNGYGFTKNNPVLPGQGDAEYRKLVEENMMVDIDKFQPEVLLVSAGFDAHVDDDMSDMKLSTEWFTWIMEKIMELAERNCRGRLISVLEGGYALNRLGELAAGHVRALLNDTVSR